MQLAPPNETATIADKASAADQLNSIDRKAEKTDAGIQIHGPKASSESEASKKRQRDFYPAVFGCDDATPLSEFFENAQPPILALKTQSSSAAPFASSKAAVPRKPLKFDPPTFKLGANSADMNDDEDSKPAAENEQALNNLQEQSNVNDVPSYCFPAVKWDEKEVDLLVECSRRWISDLKRRKVSEDRR
eukprot:CCRYP_006344-RA/>CCRYP_006344-RA protein AED:0.17 eAED:0.17 QI:325/1/1/1/0/0/2/145/189